MTQAQTDTQQADSWDGPFDASAYSAAHEILEADRARVAGELAGETRRRAKILGISAAAWAVCTVALALVNADLLAVAEVGWVAIVVWAVFYLIPTFMGKSGATDVFDQYAAQLDKLESQGIAMPAPRDMPDLVAAIDLVSPPEEE